MTRLPALDPAQETGKAKTLLARVQASLGITPNMMRTMAQSPAVLEGYLNLNSALAAGMLSPRYCQLGKVVEQYARITGCVAKIFKLIIIMGALAT